MKLLQALLEEKSSTLKTMNMMGKFLSELTTEIKEVNTNLRDIKQATKENREAIEKQTLLGGKQVIIEKQIPTSEESVINNLSETQEPGFIPSIDNDEILTISTPSKSNTVTTTKDFASKAKSLTGE